MHDVSDWRKAEIVRSFPYELKTENGQINWRTSKHVRFSAEPPLIVSDDTDNTYVTLPPPLPEP